MVEYHCTLAQRYDKFEHKLPEKVMASPKLDGVRAICKLGEDGQYHFFSRNNKQWKDEVVAHILDPMREILGEGTDYMIDGEFYKHGMTCQKINGAIAVKRVEKSEVTENIEYHIFDTDMPAPFRVRYERMVDMFTLGHDNIKVVPHTLIDKYDVGGFMVDALSNDYEGAMVRDPDSLYEYKRSYALQKVKDFVDDEFECTGVYEGAETDKGSRLLGTLGGIYLKTADGKEFGCGSGFDDATRDYYWNNESEIVGKMVTVKYFELTEEGIPRFPIFQAVRDYE